MYALRYRQELDEPVARELDALIAKFRGFLLTEHNEDGTHKFELTDTLRETLTQLIDAAQADGQWWKTGPWKLDDPDAAEPNTAGLKPPKVSTGTYNNYTPTGIDTAVVLELEPDGGPVTLTGLKALDGANIKRLLMLRNRDSGNTLTLTHEDSASVEQYRFDLPDSEDVELAPGQNVWLYYDPYRNGGRWTAAITGQTNGPIAPGTVTSGPSGGGSAELLTTTITLSQTDLVTSGLFTCIAGVSGAYIIPVRAFFRKVWTQNNTSPATVNQTITFRYGTLTSSPLQGFDLTLSLGTPTGSVSYESGALTAAGYDTNDQSTDMGIGEDLKLTRTSNGSAGACTGTLTIKIWYYLYTP